MKKTMVGIFLLLVYVAAGQAKELSMPAPSSARVEAALTEYMVRDAKNRLFEAYTASIKQARTGLETQCTYPVDVTDTQAIVCIFTQFHPVYEAYEQIRRNTVGIDMRGVGFIVVDNEFQTRPPEQHSVFLLPFMQEFLPALPDGRLKADFIKWKKRLDKDFSN